MSPCRLLIVLVSVPCRLNDLLNVQLSEWLKQVQSFRCFCSLSHLSHNPPPSPLPFNLVTFALWLPPTYPTTLPAPSSSCPFSPLPWCCVIGSDSLQKGGLQPCDLSLGFQGQYQACPWGRERKYPSRNHSECMLPIRPSPRRPLGC